MANRLVTARDVWLKIHLWLGLGIGLFFCIASATGAVIVFQTELEALLNRGRYATTPGDVGVERILERTAAEAPGAAVRQVQWPQPQEPVYQVQVALPDAPARTIRFDPGSGTVVEAVRGPNRLPALARRLHTSLFAGRIGNLLVQTASALALLSMLSGLVLWWPGLRRFLRGFAVRTRRGFYAFNFDLHQTLGALSLPLLVVMTLTGVLLPLQALVERVARPVTGSAAPPEWGAIRLDGLRADAVPVAAVARAAVAAVPDAMPGLMRVPVDSTRPAELFAQTGRWGAPGVVNVLVDPRDASVIEVRDPRLLDPAARFARTGMMRLHVGHWGGVLVRSLYVLACLIGAALPISGTLIWWLKREKRAAVVQRTPEAYSTTSYGE